MKMEEDRKLRTEDVVQSSVALQSGWAARERWIGECLQRDAAV